MQPCDWRHVTRSPGAVAWGGRNPLGMTHTLEPGPIMPRRRKPQPSADPFESAKAAGLRYVSDAAPGIRRRRVGRGFSYVGPDGRAIRDAGLLDRIRRLAIPPAYTDVWICPAPNGHLQATGRDARAGKPSRGEQDQTGDHGCQLAHSRPPFVCIRR